MQIICFHNPYEENGYLSNWYPVQFSVDGIDFSSMEQFMMYEKACCFNDEKIAKQILATNDVAKIKALGRAVKDKIWGIGLSIKDEKRYDQNMWRGQNLLGYALMMVRKQLDNRNEK